MPEEFQTFIQYARDLKFENRPDYSYLKNLLRQICEKNKLCFDYNKYDWILKKNSETSSHEHKGENQSKINEKK